MLCLFLIAKMEWFTDPQDCKTRKKESVRQMFINKDSLIYSGLEKLPNKQQKSSHAIYTIKLALKQLFTLHHLFSSNWWWGRMLKTPIA